ncbi:hypothetical protein [Nocardioides cynanchi]|uniref:hypothetical protein n=1 Tax=Nocardioides cynanchi TaxID=2558918 RepID=UPI001247EB41|nr:hypothetical protein [Nocardioides cynanchi]
MSKMDGLRAMREARYAEAEARARKGTPAPKRPSSTVATATAVRSAPEPAAANATAAAAEELCGHRNMSGRTCTREQGHAAKSHRYS